MKKIWMLVSVALVCAATFIVYNYTTSSPPNTSVSAIRSNTSDSPKKRPTKMTIPQRFIVPSLGISSTIVAVGLTKASDMAAPPDNNSLGWYENNAMPGNTGTAVLAAHTGPPDSPSIFKALHSLKKDDVLQVEDTASTIASFEIIETAIYTPESAPRERIFGTTKATQLAVITCIGQWSSEKQTYSHRFVIYAARKI